MEIASCTKLTPLVQIRTNNNQAIKICYENIVNVALIKKNSNTHNITQYFSQIWQTFTNSYLDYLFRINLVPQLFS